MELDDIDKSLLVALQEDGRYSMRALADIVGVALGTVSNRLNKLEENGVITGQTVNLDPDKIGCGGQIGRYAARRRQTPA